MLISIFYTIHLYYGKKTLYIAVASTFSGSQSFYGNEMVKGVQFYIDQINASGGLHGSQIKLLVFDDKGTEEGAVGAAKQIVRNKDILFVLGHYFSSCCTAAASIYENNMIPSITGSATSDDLPIMNEWLFRIVPPNSCQSDFLAAYAQSALNLKTATIVYDTGAYGKNLAAVFTEQALEKGIEIVEQYPLDSSSTSMDDQVDTIVQAIDTHALKPDMFFLATHADTSVKLVVGLKKKQLNQIIMGADSLASQIFIDGFKAYPKEQSSPGFYSNGIYSVSLFSQYFSKQINRIFEKNYYTFYGVPPSLISTTSYDLAHVSIEALRKIEIQGAIRDIRKKFKNALETFYDRNHCVEGLTGKIFFNGVGETKKSMIVTQLYKGHYIPAFHQYIAVSLNDISNDLIQKALDNDVMANNDDYFIKKQLVYVRIDDIQLNQINTIDGTFHARFNLWFSFQKHFQPEWIQFTNAVSPLVLKNPKKTMNKQGTTHLLYTVDSVFYHHFDLKRYPIDSQKLTISFRDTSVNTNTFIFAIDQLNKISFKLNSETWLSVDAMPYLIKSPLSGDIKNNASEFAVDIHIQRRLNQQEKLIFIACLILFLLTSISYFCPVHRIKISLVINIIFLMITTVCHLYFKLHIPFLTFSEMLFMCLYGFIGLTIMFQMGLIGLSIHHYKQSMAFVQFLGKAACLITIMMISFYVVNCCFPL